jgi:hypothetical protein
MRVPGQGFTSVFHVPGNNSRKILRVGALAMPPCPEKEADRGVHEL